jgi:hypothetical protein
MSTNNNNNNNNDGNDTNGTNPTAIDAKVPKMFCSMIALAKGLSMEQKDLNNAEIVYRAEHDSIVHKQMKTTKRKKSEKGPYGPMFRRVWIQGEVLESVNNSSEMKVSDGTGEIVVRTDGERVYETGKYVCCMGWLNKDKVVQATHVSEVKERERKNREIAWAVEVRELWDGVLHRSSESGKDTF